MEEFRRNHPRILGLIFFLIGAVGTGWLVNVYKTGGDINNYFIFLAVIGLFMGTAVIIEPRLSLAYEDETIDQRFKILSIVILGIGIVIGLLVRFVIFKDWQ